jgi:hypothetical protein
VPEITPLTYEEMLAALLGLLGRHVGFGVEVQVDGQARTLVVLYGELGRGEEADLSPFSGVVEDLPGEAIFFFVDNAYFVVREEDFQFGQRRADTLTFTVGDARFWLTALAEPGDG